MAIAFVGDATGVDSNGGTFNVSLHASSAAGNVAIAALTSYDNTADSITFTGWNRYRADGYTPGQQWMHFLYWRILTGSDPVSVTMDAQYTVWYTVTYSGAHATTPLVDTGSANSGVGTGVTGTGVPVTTAGSILFASQIGYTNGLSVGFGGMSVREAAYDGVNSWYDESVSSGPTGNRTATLGGSTDWSVTMGVIAPDGGGGGGVVATVDHSSALSFPVLCRKPANDNRVPPGRRTYSFSTHVADSGQFARSKSGIYLPKRLAA